MKSIHSTLMLALALGMGIIVYSVYAATTDRIPPAAPYQRSTAAHVESIWDRIVNYFKSLFTPQQPKVTTPPPRETHVAASVTPRVTPSVTPASPEFPSTTQPTTGKAPTAQPTPPAPPIRTLPTPPSVPGAAFGEAREQTSRVTPAPPAPRRPLTASRARAGF